MISHINYLVALIQSSFRLGLEWRQRFSSLQRNQHIADDRRDFLKSCIICIFPPSWHSSNSCALEAQIYFEVLRNFLYQILEGNFVNQGFRELCKGTLWIRDFWKRLISRSASVSGLWWRGFFTPPVEGALWCAAFVALLSSLLYHWYMCKQLA